MLSHLVKFIMIDCHDYHCQQYLRICEFTLTNIHQRTWPVSDHAIPSTIALSHVHSFSGSRLPWKLPPELVICDIPKESSNQFTQTGIINENIFLIDLHIV